MAIRLFSKFRKLLDVNFGTPADRYAPLYSTGSSKLVMRGIVSDDISDATYTSSPNKVVKFGPSGELICSNVDGLLGTFVELNVSGQVLVDGDIVSGGDLTVSGSTTLGDTTITGDLIVDGMIVGVEANTPSTIPKRDANSTLYLTAVKGQFNGIVDASLTLEGGVDETGAGASVNITGGGAVGEGLLSGGAVSISAGLGLNQSAPMTDGEALITVQPASGGDDGSSPFTTGGSIILTPGAGAGSGSNGNVIFARGNLILSAGTVTATSFIGSGADLTTLNAANLSSGTVPIARIGSGTGSTANFLRGDGAWSQTLAFGSITTSQPLTITQTWTQSGVGYNAFLVNVTNTASATLSYLARFQIGGVDVVSLDKAGNFRLSGDLSIASGFVVRSLGILYMDSASGQVINLRPGGTQIAKLATTGLTVTPSADSSSSGIAIANLRSRTYSQTGTAGSTDLKIVRTETALGNSNHRLIDAYNGASGTSNCFYVEPRWNNASTTFTGLYLDITDSNSAAASLLFNFLGGGTSRVKADKTGKVTLNLSASGGLYINGASGDQPRVVFQNGGSDAWTLFRSGTGLVIYDHSTSTAALTLNAGGTINWNSDRIVQYNNRMAVIRSSIGTTSTDGCSLENQTAATVGAQQMSPRLRFSGFGWKTNATAASQQIDIVCELLPVQGAANPTSSFLWKEQIASGGYNIIGRREGVSNSGNVTGGCYVGTGLTGIRADGGNRLEIVTGVSAAMNFVSTTAARMWGTMHLQWATITDDGNLISAKSFDVGVVRSGTNELTVSNGSTGRGNLYCNFLKTDQMSIGAAATGSPEGYMTVKDSSGTNKYIPYYNLSQMTF